jgi:hypothetical protein
MKTLRANKLIQLRLLHITIPLLLSLLIAFGLIWGLSGGTIAKASSNTLYVANSGSDDSTCTNPANPCQTIKYALNQAMSGDEILVAKGNYTETLVGSLHQLV